MSNIKTRGEFKHHSDSMSEICNGNLLQIETQMNLILLKAIQIEEEYSLDNTLSISVENLLESFRKV